MMWVCKDCDWTGSHPSWAQQGIERLQTFIEVPYCPECGSYHVGEELEPDPIYGEMGYFDDNSSNQSIIGDEEK